MRISICKILSNFKLAHKIKISDILLQMKKISLVTLIFEMNDRTKKLRIFVFYFSGKTVTFWENLRFTNKQINISRPIEIFWVRTRWVGLENI